jgi:MFS family permease
MKDSQIVGSALAEVLPQNAKYWFQTPHLLRLNLILLIPLLSSSVAGYDGKSQSTGISDIDETVLIQRHAGSLMNGLQSLDQWKDYFNHPAGALLGLINAAQSIGSVAALPFVGACSDRFGRRPVLLCGIIGVIIATIIQATSHSLAQFIVSRFVVGAAGMMIVQPAPLLIAELAYPTHRGKYTSAYWTMYYLGK